MKYWVCKNCLSAIQSHEGNQLTITHDIDLEFDERTKKILSVIGVNRQIMMYFMN